MNSQNQPSINTLGELKKSGYQNRSIKVEMRQNLIRLLQKKQEPFQGIIGYEDSVIPELKTAILSEHNILLLGLRGQAKTRIARQMIYLLDEWTPAIADTELLEDPLFPITHHAKALVSQFGDQLPIRWIHRTDRYLEKLATPDVTVADLIGDIDPIKAAQLKLNYSDERVIHFGLIPRSHRCLFVINELPDLQARIQVALFNILQERDVQIRGFKIRLSLDVAFVFTANPEDYTNRGSIVTPLKDRIESQILTHYPKSIELSKAITQQEARIKPEQKQVIKSFKLIDDLVEQIAFEARNSEYIDHKSGVSARLTISAYENLFSFAELRILLNEQKSTSLRISDLYAVVPAITGKIELVYEGEQEGTQKVAFALIGKAIRSQFIHYFPNPDKLKKHKKPNPFNKIIAWFEKGNQIDLIKDCNDNVYAALLSSVEGLKSAVKEHLPYLEHEEQLLFMEFLLFGLAEFSQISRNRLERSIEFKDMLGGLLSKSKSYEYDDEE